MVKSTLFIFPQINRPYCIRFCYEFKCSNRMNHVTQTEYVIEVYNIDKQVLSTCILCILLISHVGKLLYPSFVCHSPLKLVEYNYWLLIKL